MFGKFKKKPVDVSSEPQTELTELTFKIDGMHCTSCALNIDADLEDLPGVKSARTNYAKSTTQILFNSQLVTETNIKAVISKAGYQIHS